MIFETWVDRDLLRPVKVQYLDGTMFSQDNLGNRIGVCLYKDGEPEPVAGTVSANIIRSDGATVAVVGSASNNKAWVDLPQSAYAVTGTIIIVLKATSAGSIVTLCSLVGNVYQTSTDTIVDPGTIISSIETLIEDIESAVASIPADYSSLWTTLAPAYSTSSAYSVGDYVTYNGSLYQCTTEIPSSETWTANHWSAVVLGPEIKEIREEVSNITGVKIIDGWNDGKAYKTGTSDTITPGSPVNNAPVCCIYAPCEEGDIFTINIDNGYTSNYRPWCFIDSSGNQLKKATGNIGRYNNVEIVAPENAAFVVVNASKTLLPHYLYKGSFLQKQIDELTAKVNDPGVGTLYNWKAAIGSAGGNGWRTGYYNVNTGKYTSSPSYCCTSDIVSAPFYGYDYFIVTPPADKAVRVMVTEYSGSSTDTWIKTYGKNTESENGKSRVVPITPGHYYGVTVGGEDQSLSVSETVTLSLYAKKERPFEGLKVSLLGDSISALRGFVPAENNYYYSGSSSGTNYYGVNGTSKMWWDIAIFGAGGTPLIIDAWSGSCVASGVREPIPSNAYTPMTDVSRCENLHSWRHGDAEHYDLIVDAENIGTLRKSPWYSDEADYQIGDYLIEEDPDVVIITGGTNDYSYDCPLGTYDGHTLIDTTVTTDFRDAYANLINRINHRYPMALVVCCIPFWVLRPARNLTNTKDQTNINGIGNSYLDYQNAIREIANLKACPIIDLFSAGFTRYNYYDTFCEDSEYSPTHPNATGQKVIGLDALNQIASLPYGYLHWLMEN